MKIGLVDLDTSHPQGWVPIIRELGHEVIGVFDHGDIHPVGFAESFADEHGVATVFSSLEDMAAEVDGVILHGCNWDQHIARARPFVAAGCSVLIDKPVAGTVSDLVQIETWSAGGMRITGGSALRFCYEAGEYLELSPDERGTPHTVLCGCAVDEFSYGIHAYSLLAALMGHDAVSVRHVAERSQRRIEVRWGDGRIGWLIVGAAAGWQPFYAMVVTERGYTCMQPKPDRLYRAILGAALPYMSGQVDEPPVPHAGWLVPERWALAARQSWASGDQVVRIDSIKDDVHYDGEEFAHKYRTVKYGAEQKSTQR